MTDKKKTAAELVQTVPGAVKRRNDIILCLCNAAPVALSDRHAKIIADNIVAIANRIIELTEQ